MSLDEILSQIAGEITKEDVENAQKAASEMKGVEEVGMLVRMFAAAPRE